MADRAGFDSGWVGAGADDDLDARLATEEERFDEGQPHVLTALGAIAPGALGVTLVNGRPRPLTVPGQDLGLVLEELAHFHALGGRGIVDPGFRATAASVADLAWISTRSPVHIVAGRRTGAAMTGVAGEPRFGLNRHDSLAGLSQSRAPDLRGPIVVDGKSGPAAGDGGVGRSHPTLDISQMIVIVAAAELQSDEWNEVLTARGNLALIVSADREGERSAAVAVRELVTRGHGQQVLLGYRDDPVTVLERFPIALMEAGLTAVEVRALVVDNPARVLTRNGSSD